jgi:hypothetical protein
MAKKARIKLNSINIYKDNGNLNIKSKVLILISVIFIAIGFFLVNSLPTDVNTTFQSDIAVILLFLGYLLPIIAIKVS